MALKTHLTSKEIGALIDAAPTLRDKMIISFLADTGCRISELLQRSGPGYSMSGNEHSPFASNTLRREEETES